MTNAAASKLTPRQAEIAQLVAGGKSSREIAQALVLSVRTVENHTAAIYEKLGVGSRVALAVAVLGTVEDNDDQPLRAPRPNLPSPRGKLVGREVAVADVLRALDGNRLVTLTGAGGVGKTRVAVAVGHALPAGMFDEVWLVDLAPLAKDAPIAEAIARASGVETPAKRPILETLCAAFKRGAVLLMLDNCEHVRAAAAQAASTLLTGCERLRILATSREPLRLAGEQPYRLASLALPSSTDAPTIDAAGAAGYAAIELFALRARAVDHQFALCDANAPAVADICMALDGIPLAIELAAARMNIFSVESLAARLDVRLRLLTGGARTALPRHQTMRGLIDWSYDLLPADEALLFERLSVFSGGCTLASACAMYADAADEQIVLGVLTSLVDKSLVTVETNAEQTRYRLLESIRQYAAEKITARGEWPTLARRHAAAILELTVLFAREWDVVPVERLRARMEQELENIRAALTWALTNRGDTPLGLQLTAEAFKVFSAFSNAEARRWVLAARELVDDRTPPNIAAGLDLCYANAAFHIGDFETAAAFGRRAREALAAFGDEDRAAGAGNTAGRALVMLGRIAEGEPLLREALAYQRAYGTPRDIAIVLQSLSTFAGPTEGRALIREILEISRALGDDRAVAQQLCAWASRELFWGEIERAIELNQESIAMYRKYPDHRITDVLVNQLLCLIAGDRWEEARACAREAIDRARSQQHGWMVWIIQHLAALAVLAPATERSRSERCAGAARALGYVDAYLAKLQAPRELPEQQEYEHCTAELRRALDAQTLAFWLAEGASLTEDQAIETVEAVAL